MSKSTGYVRQITPRDEKLFIQLAKTGMASVEQSEKYVDIKIKRLKRLERSKYIKLTTLTHSGKETTIIQLGDKGKKYLSDKLLYEEKLAVENRNQVSHDLQLTDKYYKLEPEYQKTFTCEKELAARIYREHPELKGKLPTCLDATIQVDGKTEGIEVIGKNYRQADIDLKIEIAQKYLNCTKITWINNTGRTFKF